MAEEDDKATRYEVVWNRVKVYIPFLQELISFYKNDTHQNRQQQLQKIITIYDLLTNQRLNYLSLCKCEKVLIKLYETNPLKKVGEPPTTEGKRSTTTNKCFENSPASPCDPGEQAGFDMLLERRPKDDNPLSFDSQVKQDTSTKPAPSCDLDFPAKPEILVDPDTPAEPESSTEPDSPAELVTPAEPDTPEEPDSPAAPPFHNNSGSILEPLSPETDNDEFWDDPAPKNSRNITSKQPLSLDEITRLITSDPKPGGSQTRNNISNNNLSQLLKNTLKVFQKPTFEEHQSPPYENLHHGRNPNISSSTFPSQIATNHGSRWEPENDAFGGFPHPVNNSYRNFPGRNSNNIDFTPRSQSPPLYRRRDDVKRFNDERMDSSPSDNRASCGSAPAVNMKDPRIRKAVESTMHMHSPEHLGTDRTNPFFPTLKSNDPRLNRPNVQIPQATIPNDLPRCVAPNPNLPLDLPKKDPPKRRLSICANQVIIEEIPPEPVMLPPLSFPARRQSICGEFNANRNNEPFHGTSFLSTPPSIPPIVPQPMPPLMLPHSHPSGQIPPPLLPHSSHFIQHPQQNSLVLSTPQSMDTERDPRRKHLPLGTEYLQSHHQNQQPHNRFQHTSSGSSKTPLTYLEYRRQKEINQKYHKNQNKPNSHSPEKKDKEKQISARDDFKQNEEIDITIGMVPNKNRVAAKAYAKPAKVFTPKERKFSHATKEKPRTDSKLSTNSHKYDSLSTSKKVDNRREESNKDKIKPAPKSKDLFGEQLSQFDKMYRSGDFLKKTAPSSSIGGFKIPKIKRNENPNELSVKPVEAVQHTSQRNDKAKSKSPEPMKHIVDEDDMWDTDIGKRSSEIPQREEEVPKNRNTPLTSLNDDDCWDTEPSGSAIQPVRAAPLIEAAITSTADAVVQMETSEVGDKKQKETMVEEVQNVFQVPSLPAPRRTLRRRNSVSVHCNEIDMSSKSPLQAMVAPKKISNHLNPVVAAQSEVDARSAEKIEKEMLDRKEAEEETETETEDIVIRPRRIRKRKPVIEDDDEDTSGTHTDTEPSLQGSMESDEMRKDNAVRELPLTPAKMDSSDNVVSSTTSDTKAKKRKRGRKKNESATTVNKELSNDVNHDKSNKCVLTVEASSSGENSVIKDEKSADIKEDPYTSEAAKEAKEDRENKEMVEDLLKGSTNPDNKEKLLEMLSKILDEKKLRKIQEIIEGPSDKPNNSEDKQDNVIALNPENLAERSRERTASTSISSTIEAHEKEKASANKRKKSELDKLNEDIAEMYIRDGVLSATGRRSCTQRHAINVSSVKRTVSKNSTSTQAEKKLYTKGMEFKLTEKVNLKCLKVVVQKVDLSKFDIPVNQKPNKSVEKIAVYETEDDVASIASSGTSVSPRSKKKKRGGWASGTVPKRRKKIETKLVASSPPKTYVPKPVTKNVNKELHCKSDTAKDCALCSYTGPLRGIVQHYVRNHPLHEVYVSRIPNEVAVKLKKEPLLVTGIIRDQNITFKCIFCQEVLTKKKYNWKLHLASHTGEYRYKCNNCTIKSLAPSTSAHDTECAGPAMDVTNDVMFKENHVHGYMCRLCNFVQLSRTKVDAHMKVEHDRTISGNGILRFSVLNYDETLELRSHDTLESDISMPELTPQITVPDQTNISAFISSANDEIESLKVFNDQNFVSPSKPSIIDKLKKNFDEIMKKHAEKTEGDEDEWEDIDSPPKEVQTQLATKRVDKVKRSLTAPISSSENIPMPTPLDMKKENVDIFEHKQLVSNVGYSQINEKIWYLCLIGDCKYATLARSEMYSHVKELHGSILWDGYCYLCTAQVLDEESCVLSKEVKHMAVIHIKDRSAFDELNEPPQTESSSNMIDDRPMLKLRRFSGDKLSIGTIEESINLKPWLNSSTIKNRAHCVNMLEQKSLFCFYKCMGESCCFTTTTEALMEKHIDNHELVGDISGTGSSKSWLECAYCDVVAEGKTDLLLHLRSVHSGSAYQCAYCFYRSREAYNVVVHQRLHHEKEKTTVLVYEVDKRPLTPADYERLNRRPIDNIVQLICTVCNAEYCVLDAYMAHLKDDHADVTTIVCQCCKETIQKLKIPRHLLQHNIGIYECIYCQYGSNTMEAVQVHVCNRHPQEPLFCCIRYNKVPGKIKEASLKSLCEKSVDETALVFCSFQPEELNYKSPDTKSNHDINFTAKPGVIPLQLPPIRIGDANIFLSAQIPSTSPVTSSMETSNQSVFVTANTAEIIKIPMISSVSGGVSLTGTSTVPIITAVQGNYQGLTTTGSSPSLSMPVISHVVGGAKVSNMPIITRVEGGVADVARLKPASSLIGTKIIISPNKGGTGFPIITNVCSIGSSIQQAQSPKEDDNIMLEAERIAIEMIKDTGLPKNVIYKCIFKGCNSILPDGTGMRKHLSFSHLPAASYTCSHCKNKPSFQNVMLFTQHLKTHEAQRIFCFMCDYKGSFPPEVIKHVKDVHKTTKPTILFLNPKKNDPNNDIILFAPGIPTDSERKAYYRKLIDLYNHKMQAALIHLKTHFAPEECENLPKQAIFSQTVYCSKCQYSTKVRLNMYRHLKGHLNDMPVSNMDPKNPVPCWGQGEKHFDRMRNPAASSQEDDDLIQSLCFVQENKRFICGAPDCRYLTINEGMLKNHLSTLHMDVKEYKCPHCPAVHIFSGQLNVGKVLEHLKLHDKELYRCSKCSIFMNKKKDLQQHVDEKHTAQDVSVYVIRDGSTAGSVSSTGMAEDSVVFKWKCDVCKFKSPTIGEMRSHMQETHNITAKYRCSRCLYSCSNKSLFTIHFEKQHPGCEIVIISLYKAIDGDDSRADTTPLWRRETNKTRSIRGILVEDEDEDEDEPNSVDMAAISVEPQAGPSGLNIPRKRRSSDNNESEVSPKRTKEDYSVVRAFKCGFKGCTFVNDFGSGIVTHFRTAHPFDKPSVLRNALANPEQSRFDYFMKYACYYCVKKADTIQDLVMHWRQMHKILGRRSQDKPFLFRASKIILCFYCRKGAVMPEMKSHFTSYHPGNQPIYLDFRNPKRCAECDFFMGSDKQEMVRHFAAEHKNENEYANGWIDFLTDEVVDKILQLNSVIYRCEKCDFSANCKTDFAIHYATKHPGLRVEFNEYEMEKTITYYCAFSNCKSSWNSPKELAEHIQYHILLFKCMCNTVQCSAQFRSFVMLLEHFNTTHPQQDLQYALKTPEEYKSVLRSINIQFWNGFVMTLDDARRAGNRYGSHDFLFKYIDELCAKSVAAGVPQQPLPN